MADEHDELTRALRAVARQDAEDASVVLRPVSRHLAREFRATRSTRRPSPTSRRVGIAMAATLVAAMAVSLWIVARGTRPQPRVADRSLPRIEIVTAFMPLPYGTVPMTEGHIVRLQVPRRALIAFGLAPVDAVDAQRDTVMADVLVGEDGLARAVRFVRPSRTAGDAP